MAKKSGGQQYLWQAIRVLGFMGGASEAFLPLWDVGKRVVTDADQTLHFPTSRLMMICAARPKMFL